MKEKKENPLPIQLLEGILKHYSPSGEEGELSQFLQEQILKLGFNVSQDQVGNVIGTIGHGAPEILLCGHMDTVPGEIPVSIKKGRLYGRGAVDAKAPLAAMIIAAHELSKQDLETRITVVAAVDEEGEGKGIKNLLKRHLTPHYAIFGEPSGSENIIIGYKGSLTLNLSCKTDTGHSAAPWLYDNAIESIYDIWDLISNLEFPKEDKSSYFYSVTKCLTKIEGGSMYNIVPHTCHARIDVRVPPQIKPEELQRRIQKKLETWSSKNRSIAIKTIWEGGLKGYEADKNSLLVNAFNIAIRKVKRCQGSLVKKTGSSDMNLMAEKLHVPMIAYGPGDSRLDHTPNEHILINEYLDGIQVLKEAIKTLVLLHSRST